MMKKAVLLIFTLLTLLVLFACNVGPVDGSLESGVELKQEEEIGVDELLSELQRRGFNTEDHFIYDGQLVVEGDIGFDIEKLEKEMGESSSRQFADSYLVSQSKVGLIYVKTTPDMTKEWNDAVDTAIAAWNSIPNCRIKLSRTTYGVGDIVISNDLNKEGYRALASFPDSDGNPGATIKINPDSNDLPPSIKEAVMVHEIGHCLGMRHINITESNRVHIPGTPVRDIHSIMVHYIKIWDGFSEADMNAAQYLYPDTREPYIVVYQHSWFKGKRWIIYPGNDIAKTASIHLNNSISSIKSFNGAQVNVYDGEAYRGDSLTVLSNGYYDLKQYGFNDRISSIRWNVPTGPFAIVYTDKFFKGKSMILTGSQVNLASRGFDNNISSVKLVNGLRSLTLYDKSYLRGTNVTLTSHAYFLDGLQKFDNKTSSILISK